MKHITIPFEIINTKQIEENGQKYFTIKGYGSTFNNKDRQGDVMVKGCFEKSLKEMDPIFLWQHNITEPIGVFAKLCEDEKGLYLEAKMPLEDDLVKGRVIPQVKIGSVRTMSIGFGIVSENYDMNKKVNYIKEVKLYEVSLVTIPANPKATISEYKELDYDIKNATTIRDIENLLKKIGISNKKSVKIISNIKSIVRDEQSNQCDIDTEINKFIKGVSQLKMEV